MRSTASGAPTSDRHRQSLRRNRLARLVAQSPLVGRGDIEDEDRQSKDFLQSARRLSCRAMRLPRS